MLKNTNIEHRRTPTAPRVEISRGDLFGRELESVEADRTVSRSCPNCERAGAAANAFCAAGLSRVSDSDSAVQRA